MNALGYTAADLERLSDGDDMVELVRGELVSEPRPGYQHGDIQLELGAALHSFARRQGLGDVVVESGFVLATAPDTVRGPDVAFLARDRLPQGELRGFFRGAPDLAVEIVSPSDRPGKIGAKVADYLAAGSRLVWIVDPGPRTVTVHRADGTVACLGHGDRLSGEDVVPGFHIELAQLFG